MKPIWDAWLFQIDITYFCPKACVYCSRHMRHMRDDQRFHMTPEYFRKVLDSLTGWIKPVGIIGGEPTISPYFPEICEIIQEYKRTGRLNRFSVFTAKGPLFERRYQMIDDTFNAILINEHTEDQQAICRHQPMTVAIQEAVPDPVLREKLIDVCWCQEHWCPTITSKGGFFCEIAAAWDHMLDGPGGYALNPGWWKKTPEEFRDQRDRYCKYCGMPIPMPRQHLKDTRELVTPGNLELFRQHNLNRIGPEDVIVFDKQYTPAEIEENRKFWGEPWNYHEDIPGGPGTGDGILKCI